MRFPWRQQTAPQLDLLALEASSQATVPGDEVASHTRRVEPTPVPEANAASAGAPMQIVVALIDEDPNNPRTEFPDAEIDELADDIRRHGILQPIVVHPADEQGRYRIHFGAKRFRAAQRAGLIDVPVVLRDAPTDPYTQVAENQKRHGLTPLDLARFIRSRVDAGESNGTIAKRMGMDLTSVAHHLELLDLPPVLHEAPHAGRCTSPRTLHELSELHRSQPDRVQALLAGDQPITRGALRDVRPKPRRTAKSGRARLPTPTPNLLAAALTACERLESALVRIAHLEPPPAEADLALLKQRLVELVKRLT
jgi:ParB family transcriptional regulator, chromosome partitioning protein